MRKFYILVKKEIRELLTPQMIIPLIAVVLVFVFIGKVVTKQAAQSAQKNSSVAVLDLDNSNSSKNLEETLKNSHFDVTIYQNISPETAVETVKKDNKNILVVIPAGFEQNLKSNKVSTLPTYTIMENFSFTGSKSIQNLTAVMAAINENLSNAQISKLLPGANLEGIKQPVKTDNNVIVGNNEAHISPAAISGFITSQTTFIPIILFLVIVFASQLIATSIATEKENKTLETLLSSPVSRKSVVAAKLVGAGLVALLFSAIYLFGMKNLTGTSGSMGSADTITQQAAQQLGLVFNTTDYIMLGLSLFFGILTALSIALILGSLAEDAKSAQGVVTPLMMLILIPYFVVMLLDINTVSPGLRYLIYAIPFSHPFLAAPNLMLHQYTNVWLGIGYMAILFLFFVFIAAKFFASDKIFTLNLNLRKRK